MLEAVVYSNASKTAAAFVIQALMQYLISI